MSVGPKRMTSDANRMEMNQAFEWELCHATGTTPIRVRSSWLDQIAVQIVQRHQSFAVITDSEVDSRYGSAFDAALGSALHGYGGECDGLSISIRKGKGPRGFVWITIPAGEKSKSLAMFESVCQQLSDAGLDRQSAIVALGGGVPGDLAGFVAASWMRGIAWYQVPTTLMAQVDSAIGGKTGINLPAAKNTIGAFWQPQAVFTDTAFLRTLGDREFTSGLAEVVKYGMALDAELLAWLEGNVAAIVDRQDAALTHMVQWCGRLKSQVVEQDERETRGRRAVLNYGHTLGHALETQRGYGDLAHGHAVAAGMHFAAVLSHVLDRVPDSIVARQRQLMEALTIPLAMPRDGHEALIQVMQRDKKSVQGHIRFVLLNGAGDAELAAPVDPVHVRRALNLAAESLS